MGLLGSHSKECPDCTRRYPQACGIATCLACRKPLEITKKEPTVTEDEFKNLSYIHGRTIPGPLSAQDREAWDSEWQALEAEAERRAPWYTIADLIGDGFSVRPTH